MEARPHDGSLADHDRSQRCQPTSIPETGDHASIPEATVPAELREFRSCYAEQAIDGGHGVWRLRDTGAGGGQAVLLLPGAQGAATSTTGWRSGWFGAGCARWLQPRRRCPTTRASSMG